jgi:hypothetical protein
MIIHQREISYRENYSEFFDALVKVKAYMAKKYPQISVELMYNLAGQRGRATIVDFHNRGERREGRFSQ